MKPKILTRLANIVAKLAGSPDYDPSVKPITPLEFYADRLPVVPVPSLRDDGKMLVAYGEGTYALVQPTQPAVTPEDVVSATEEMSKAQKKRTKDALDYITTRDALIVTFSGSTEHGNAHCDTAHQTIVESDIRRIVFLYMFSATNYRNLPIVNWYGQGTNITINAGVYVPEDPSDPTTSYTYINCTLNYDGTVDIVFEDV